MVARLIHKFKPADQAHMTKREIWRKRNKRLPAGCTAKEFWEQNLWLLVMEKVSFM